MSSQTMKTNAPNFLATDNTYLALFSWSAGSSPIIYNKSRHIWTKTNFNDFWLLFIPSQIIEASTALGSMLDSKLNKNLQLDIYASLKLLI